MSFAMPDPVKDAQARAQLINANRVEFLVYPVDRIITDSPTVDRRLIEAEVGKFHRQRIERVPSAALYPESKPWVDYQIKFESELRRLCNLTDTELGVHLSLGLYLAFRGYRLCAPPPARDEKCRVAYLPETDRGVMHIKNVDDPITHWKPKHGRPPYFPYEGDLVSDGVGSGLHLDDEPAELFPLPVHLMRKAAGCGDVPAAVEFYRRYRYFWGGANILLHDKQLRSAAIEKASYNHFEVFYPGADGRSHISGMTCRDPNSPQGKYHAAKRAEYVRLYRKPDDCIDNRFWAKCAELEHKLSTALAAFPRVPKAADVIKLFVTTYPAGLNKPGIRVHPTEGLVGYTLVIECGMLTERKFLQWMRSEDGKSFDAEPREYQF